MRLKIYTLYQNMRKNHFESHHSGEGEPAKIHNFVFGRLLTGTLLVKAANAPL